MIADNAHISDSKPAFGHSIGFVAGGIGDQIYHLTQLRTLATVAKDGVIDIACIHPGPIGQLLANSSWVGRIIDARPLRRYVPVIRGQVAVDAIKRQCYDTAFFMHRSTSFKIAAMAAGINYRVGLYGHWLDRAILHHRLNDTNGTRSDVWGHRPFIGAIDDFVAASGLTLDETTPTILPSKHALAEADEMLAPLSGPIIILNLFAADPMRRWSINAALESIMHLAEVTGGTFILNAGPDAHAYHEECMTQWQTMTADKSRKIQAALVNSLAHNPSMAKDVALYHRADFYVGVDSFTANLALNCNLPALILFARESDILRYRSVSQAVAAPDDGDISSIPTEKIIMAFEKLSKITKVGSLSS
ncbi:glycosyltransferase family 9 protein [Candidatus Puniceispirillum marinum]|uniref:Glycosyl transferase, family 9 n=1 Tax=Puniceispirillum marinum (strain IMCC1322) TaxID=488538 RepID=D5BRS8_PUNMI|nr:glycosyl transferase [Candidatus Puniceispirillum marinum]ADE38975.1 glycosyl transferase, family 9 [Candidatus Puniceispirillum marinum IMCC1322]